ncbi:MAG: hypothetical protein FWH54_05930 [Methanobrevibacter sp.]|nr:hypothetical protein [Methanobrevibacter sp.]
MLGDIWVNKKYAKEIEEDLISLDDYIPPVITGCIDVKRRNEYLSNSEDGPEIMKYGLIRKSKKRDLSLEDVIRCVKEELINFVGNYPDWKNLVKLNEIYPL